MRFSAVICASHVSSEQRLSGTSVNSDGLLRASLHFAGHSLVEYQARQAAEAGAAHVMILVSAVTQPLSRAVDRLTSDGITVSLVRDMVTLVREAPRDRDMLLIGDGAIIAQRHVDAIAAASGNALLVVDDTRPTAMFERIDGQHRWAGLMRVAPELLFGTLDMLGDWDLELTLMRAAVQAGGQRIVVPQEDVLEGRVALIDSQASADLVAQALLGGRESAPATHGGAEHYLLSHAAARIAPMLLRTQVPAIQIRIGGMGLAAIGTIAVVLAWPVVGLVLMLGALILSLTADRLTQLARRSARSGWIDLAPAAIVLIGIALLGDEADVSLNGLYLASLIAIITLGVRWQRIRVLPPWMLFTPGSALLLLIAGSFLVGIGTTLAVAIFCAIGSIAVALLGLKAPENGP